MIQPVASYQAEFGQFFAEFPYDPATDDAWSWVQLGNLVLACHVRYEPEDVLHLSLSLDHHTQRGEDVRIQKVTVLELTEKDGEYTFADFSDNDEVLSIMPRGFFGDQHVLLPSMLRTAWRTKKQWKGETGVQRNRSQ